MQEYFNAVLLAICELPFSITREELQRAKNQLKGTYVVQLDSKLTIFEDMTRQVSAFLLKYLYLLFYRF